jgi:hypothetical protein
MFYNLGNEAAFLRSNGVGNAATNTSATFKCDGYDSALLMVDLGAVQAGAVLQLNALNGVLSNGSDANQITDQAGNPVQTTSVTDSGGATSNTTLLLDVHRSGGKTGNDYITACLTRTGGAVVNSFYAIMYNAKQVPVTQPSTVTALSEFLAAT